MREEFETEEVVRLDCTHVGMSDCKRIGVKLKVWVLLVLFVEILFCKTGFDGVVKTAGFGSLCSYFVQRSADYTLEREEELR